MGGRKKYSLASFGLRVGLCDLQECIFLVRCLSFGLCHANIVERNEKIENCHAKVVERIVISEKCQPRSIKRNAKITDCQGNIVKRNEKSEKRNGNFVEQVVRK